MRPLIPPLRWFPASLLVTASLCVVAAPGAAQETLAV